MGHLRFFIGVFFLIWAALNSWFTVDRYGFELGIYSWFGILALWATALGILFQERALLISFLAVSLITHSFWILDNFAFIVFKKDFFGFGTFLYHPGLPLDEFFLSHYHFFLIPTLAYFSLLFPERIDEKKRISFYVLGLNFLFFGLSYFIFSVDSRLYWALFAGVIVLNFIIAQTIASHRFEFSYETLNKAFVGILACGILLTGLDLGFRARQPHLVCEQPYEDGYSKVECRPTTEVADKKMMFRYEVTNKSSQPTSCTVLLSENGGEYLPLQENLWFLAREKIAFSIAREYPANDVKIQFQAKCY